MIKELGGQGIFQKNREKIVNKENINEAMLSNPSTTQ